jgi:flagellar hook-associated protein 1 FlgK
VQGLRQDTETQMASQVTTLNQSLSSLADVNAQLAGGGGNDSERAALEDQRDRLVSQVSEIVDVRVDYRSDDTVGLSTRTGISILDAKPSTFSFQPAGTLTADKQFNVDPSKSGVGTLTLTTPSGSTIDLVQQNVLQSGSLAALVNLRDTTLVNAQSQLDSVAAGVAQSFSTVQTPGTAVTVGAKGGYSADLSSIRDGNDFVLNYTQGGAQKSLRVVRVDDSSKLPLDYTDANGARVIGMSFAGGASGIATALGNVLGPGFTVSGSGSTLTVLDDGAASTTDVGSLTTDATVTGLQTGNSAFSLFTDSGNSDFTNALDGKGQATGFASRIQVNSAILSNNNLLVQYDPTSSVGDPTRVNAVLSQLQTMSFASPQTATGAPATFRVGGTVSDMISQTMNNVGSVAQSASTDNDTQQMTLDSVNQRLSSEYGVNVDDEMARLIQLQNAYAANARIISTVQDLMGRLLDL